MVYFKTGFVSAGCACMFEICKKVKAVNTHQNLNFLLKMLFIWQLIYRKGVATIKLEFIKRPSLAAGFFLC